jgi:arylsulfatase A-like enzyme
MEGASIDSELRDVLQRPREPVEHLLEEGSLQERLADGTGVYRLPVGVDLGEDGEPVLLQWTESATELPKPQLISARRRITLENHPAFRGFKRPRTPSGERGVLIDRNATIALPLEGAGAATEITLEAGFIDVAQWRPEDLPRVRISMAGRDLATLDLSDPQLSRPTFALPAYVGRRDLEWHFDRVKEGSTIPKLVLLRLQVQVLDDIDRLLVTGEPWSTLRYLPRLPPAVQTLLPERAKPVAQIEVELELLNGPCALYSPRPQRWEVSFRGTPLASSAATPGTELALPVDEYAQGTLRVRGAGGVLLGPLYLLQPVTLWQRPIQEVRGPEGGSTASPLVRYFTVGALSRRSLLATAPTSVRWPVELLGTERLEFSWGMRVLPSQQVPAQPALLRWSFESSSTAAGAGKELHRVPLDQVGRWQEQVLTIPMQCTGPGTLVLEVIPPRRTPVAARQAIVAVAEPRLRRPAEQRPANVLVYLIDTLRADHVSAYGYSRPTTPAIDALARDGVLFARAYSQAPWTRPSVATLFSGLLYSFHGAGKTTGLAPELTTLTEHLRDGGLLSAAFVTNAQIHGRGLNFEQGFTDFFAVEETLGASRASQVNQLVLPWLEHHHRQPFFLYVHTIDPHSKYDPPPHTAGRFRKPYNGKLTPAETTSRMLRDLQLDEADVQFLIDLYDEEILANDRAFGRLVQALKEHGVYEDTLIVVLSDHGEEFRDHGRFGHGGRLWEELLHVPLVIKLPGSDRPRGVRVEERVRILDVFPTVAAALGRPLAEGRVQGLDLTPLWARPGEVTLDIIAEEQPDQRTFIRGDLKVIQKELKDGPEIIQFYDLGQDPSEQQNLFDQQAEQARVALQQMFEQLQGFRQQGFEPAEDILEWKMSAAELDALRELGYVDE